MKPSWDKFARGQTGWLKERGGWAWGPQVESDSKDHNLRLPEELRPVWVGITDLDGSMVWRISGLIGWIEMPSPLPPPPTAHPLNPFTRLVSSMHPLRMETSYSAECSNEPLPRACLFYRKSWLLVNTSHGAARMRSLDRPREATRLPSSLASTHPSGREGDQIHFQLQITNLLRLGRK